METETYTANFAVIFNDNITLKNNRPTISPLHETLIESPVIQIDKRGVLYLNGSAVKHIYVWYDDVYIIDDNFCFIDCHNNEQIIEDDTTLIYLSFFDRLKGKKTRVAIKGWVELKKRKKYEIVLNKWKIKNDTL